MRVRRVNPPEPERAALRSGERAPERMDTPKALLAVLLRKLEPQCCPAPLRQPRASPGLATAGVGRRSRRLPLRGQPPRASVAVPEACTPLPPAALPRPPARGGSAVVQVGAFSSKANAEATAAKVGGSVSPAGRLLRVRIGPFATRGEAAAALAKAKGAGYSDARIQRAD